MWKKILAIVLVLLIAVAWLFSVTDLGWGTFQDHLKLGLDFQGGAYVVLQAETDAEGTELRDIMEQTQMVIEQRVNQMGLSEPVVTIEGENKIRVELPAVDSSSDAIKNIGRTAQLYFVLGDGSVILDGSQVANASMGTDEMGFPAVDLEFTSEGAAMFEQGTTAATAGVTNASTGQPDHCIYIVLDDEVISYPEAHETISGGKAQITGKFTQEETATLSALIRGGSLPVGLTEVETSVVGPTLGMDSLNSSVVAGVVGVGLVMVFMLLMYWGMGLVADLALALYILITFWILALFGAVLNLPGIAGIILSIGMAVDSNVIIFARVREEFANGKSLRVATDSGFKRALATIIDSQVTTLIAGLILYSMGTGPVRGFALTLMIGIVVSVVTAVCLTQFLLKTMVGTKLLGREKIFGVTRSPRFKKEFHFMKYRKIFYIVAVLLIVVGVGTGLLRGFNFGIDFTGGTMIHIDMGTAFDEGDLNKLVSDAGYEATVTTSGDTGQEAVIKTTSALENDARQELLQKIYDEYSISEENVLGIEQFSASVGDLFKKNAVKAVILAALAMLLYIIIRFEWKFGVAAIAALIHDVLIVIAFYGLFHIPINNPFIAGILTVVGYSINDTIVVFDRIRENKKYAKFKQTEEMIDRSINQVLMRSIYTSLTTVIVLIPLYILGGQTIHNFVLPLIVGIIAGAFSSIIIASPIFYDLERFMNRPKYDGINGKKKAVKVIEHKAEIEHVEKETVEAEPEMTAEAGDTATGASTAAKAKPQKKAVVANQGETVSPKKKYKQASKAKAEAAAEAKAAAEAEAAAAAAVAKALKAAEAAEAAAEAKAKAEAEAREEAEAKAAEEAKAKAEEEAAEAAKVAEETPEPTATPEVEQEEKTPAEEEKEE